MMKNNDIEDREAKERRRFLRDGTWACFWGRPWSHWYTKLGNVAECGLAGQTMVQRFGTLKEASRTPCPKCLEVYENKCKTVYDDNDKIRHRRHQFTLKNMRDNDIEPKDMDDQKERDKLIREMHNMGIEGCNAEQMMQHWRRRIWAKWDSEHQHLFKKPEAPPPQPQSPAPPKEFSDYPKRERMLMLVIVLGVFSLPFFHYGGKWVFIVCAIYFCAECVVRFFEGNWE
jgi:hypothetical protein